MSGLYHHQTILLASKHAKETVLAPLFQETFNSQLIVPSDFDTDQFGTFCGQTERQHSAIDTCVLKARTAAKQYGHSFAIATEGSFGPDPHTPFVATHHETIVFWDAQRNLLIKESIRSHNTNYAQQTFAAHEDYSSFLKQIQFPSHAVIIRDTDTNQVVAKGINQDQLLTQRIKQIWGKQHKVQIETDMRAMHNPQRMTVIGQVAKRLIRRLQTDCRACAMPGFGEVHPMGNLPCANCQSPSPYPAFEQLRCVHCEYSEQQPRADGRTTVDPINCPLCNP